MNLSKLMIWKQATTTASAMPVDAPATAGEGNFEGNPTGMEGAHSAKVIPLPRTEGAAVLGDMPALEEPEKASPERQRVKGLMNAPELECFFKTNQFGFGRHHGGHYRTAEAMERGLDALVAEFQNIVAEMVERRQAKLDRLQLARQDVATLSGALAQRLDLAGEHARREIAVLREQHTLAEQRKGWVLDALNRYRLGFDRGLREALDFELLNA